MASPRRRGAFIIPGDRYSPNDDNIKALGLIAQSSRTPALLPDPAIWATIARIVRQSGA
jgi:hypothetical protein